MGKNLNVSKVIPYEHHIDLYCTVDDSPLNSVSDLGVWFLRLDEDDVFLSHLHTGMIASKTCN